MFVFISLSVVSYSKNPVKGEGFHELIQEWDRLKFKSIQQKLWLERNQIQKHTLTAFES